MDLLRVLEEGERIKVNNYRERTYAKERDHKLVVDFCKPVEEYTALHVL